MSPPKNSAPATFKLNSASCKCSPVLDASLAGAIKEAFIESRLLLLKKAPFDSFGRDAKVLPVTLDTSGRFEFQLVSAWEVRVTGNLGTEPKTRRESCRAARPSGYEGNAGVHVVQAKTANPWKIQHIGASELGRFGSCCTAFSHRKGIEPPGPTLMDFKFPSTTDRALIAWRGFHSRNPA